MWSEYITAPARPKDVGRIGDRRVRTKDVPAGCFPGSQVTLPVGLNNELALSMIGFGQRILSCSKHTHICEVRQHPSPHHGLKKTPAHMGTTAHMNQKHWDCVFFFVSLYLYLAFGILEPMLPRLALVQDPSPSLQGAAGTCWYSRVTSYLCNMSCRMLQAHNLVSSCF